MADDRFQIIWDSYHHRLEKYIRNKVADPHQAEDILQDVFLKIQRSLRTLKETSSLEAWIFKIAKYTIIDFYRSRNRIDLPENIVHDPRIEKEFEAVQGVQAVTAMIQTLPDKYAEVVRLFEIEKMTSIQIAEQTGLSVPAVKSRLLRGKSMLKEKLKACCDITYARDGSICDIRCTDRFPKIMERSKK